MITEQMVEAERKRFEAWATKRGLDTTSHIHAWSGTRTYDHEHIESMWLGWNSATALSQAEGAQVERIEDGQCAHCGLMIGDVLHSMKALPTRPREQEGAEPAEMQWNQRRLRDLVDIAVSWAYECPNYMARKHADQLIAMVIAGKKPEYAAVARLDGFPSAPLPAASFQAGAEAMREAAVVRPLRWVAPSGNTFDEMRAAVQLSPLYQDGDTVLVWVNEGDLHMHSLSGLYGLPIPASSEGR